MTEDEAMDMLRGRIRRGDYWFGMKGALNPLPTLVFYMTWEGGHEILSAIKHKYGGGVFYNHRGSGRPLLKFHDDNEQCATRLYEALGGHRKICE